MPNNYDPNDTRWLAERTAREQRERFGVMKAISATVAFAALPVGTQANVRKVLCYNANGSLAGLVRPARIRATNTVTKADAVASLRAVFDEHGNIIGVIDPADLQGAAAGEHFSYNADGMVVGIIGTDGKERPVTPALDPKSVPGRSASEVAEANQRAKDAAAHVSATAPAVQSTVPAPTAPVSVVAKALSPDEWNHAVKTLRELRVKLMRERVTKAQAMDTRNLGPREEVIKCLEAMEPLFKMGPPPAPTGSEAMFRHLGKHRLDRMVTKGTNLDPRIRDTLFQGALARVNMSREDRAKFDDGLKREFSLADRHRTVKALRIAIQKAKDAGWQLDSVDSLHVVAKSRRAQG